MPQQPIKEVCTCSVNFGMIALHHNLKVSQGISEKKGEQFHVSQRLAHTIL